MKLLAVLIALAIPASAADDEQLWAVLKGGGQVILIRHAITTPGVGDPSGFRLDDCSTQRNLTDEGRAHARRVGDAFRARGVPVARVLSSPWCRCLETARVAFTTAAEVSTPLSNLLGRPEAHDDPGGDGHQSRDGRDGRRHAAGRRALHRRRPAERPLDERQDRQHGRQPARELRPLAGGAHPPHFARIRADDHPSG